MPMKDWLHRFQPVQLYVVLVFSIVYFLVQLFLSHITHALTLLVDSYHMLCNIIALTGCILTIKHSKRKINIIKNETPQPPIKEEARFVEVCLEKKQTECHHHELKLRNTFGWTRIDILTMLIVCIFLASLSFSLLVEALQTLVHINHQDTMHHPIPILILGAVGLVLNGLCYLLIGGYTLHQGSFLHITSSGDVILDHVTSGDGLKPGERRLSRTKREHHQLDLSEIECPGKRQGIYEMFRDICSTIFVIVCAIIVYFADDDNVAKFVDPVISIASCIILLFLSYPYMKESCLILLQTIPGSIDIEHFKSTLLSTFQEIVSVHDLHIWQLTASKYVSTVHIIFQDPQVYTRIMEEVKNFFHEQGITIVTIQPEFKTTKLALQEECLVQCHDIACAEKHCCKMIGSDVKEIIHKECTQQQQQQIATSQQETVLKILPNLNDTEKSKSIDNLNIPEINGEFKRFSSDSQLSNGNSTENAENSVNDLEQDKLTKTTEKETETTIVICACSKNEISSATNTIKNIE